MSVGHCGRLFMQVLQTTPYEYLINYRIKKSLELLGKEKTIISQIALEVGFNDVSHFIQSFKKRMSITQNNIKNSFLVIKIIYKIFRRKDYVLSNSI